MADPLAVELAASAARTASGSGSAVDIGTTRGAIRLLLDISAASGTFTAGQGVTASVETSPTGTGWVSVGSFTVASTVTHARKAFANLERYVRLTWVITGTTPSLTFSVAGEAHQLYCTPADLSRYGINAAALAGIAADIQADGCLGATDYAVSKLRRRYTMPLVSWSEDVRGHCARLAVEEVMIHRGLKPGTGPDDLIFQRASRARKELESIGAGHTHPEIVDSSPAKRGAAPRVYARGSSRGWDDQDTEDSDCC